MAEIIGGRPLFQGCYEDGQLCAIFDVLGVPDDKTCPGFSSTPFATNLLPELDVHQNNYLRELFPEATLSKEGFEASTASSRHHLQPPTSGSLQKPRSSTSGLPRSTS